MTRAKSFVTELEKLQDGHSGKGKFCFTENQLHAWERCMGTPSQE